MNNNQISNPKTNTPTGLNMNDKDYLTCFVSCLKELTKNYATSLTEASNNNLYNSHHSIFQELSKLQREAYQLMFQKGWYTLEKADTNKITQKHQN